MASGDVVKRDEHWGEEGVTKPDDWVFGRLQRRMNDLFESFFSESWGRPWSGRPFVPDVDVKRADGGLDVTAELPGMDQKDFEVTVEQNAVTIRGEKREEKHQEDEKGKSYCSECRYGSFVRTIPISTEFDPEHAKAEFRNGVLQIHIPKNPQAEQQRKRIPIQTSET